MNFSKEDIQQLLDLAKERRVYLEGNIIKIIKTDNEEFKKYLKEAKEKDSETRKKRLEITRQVQDQNKQLAAKAEENEQNRHRNQ